MPESEMTVMNKKLLSVTLIALVIVGALFLLFHKPTDPTTVAELGNKYHISFSNIDVKQSNTAMVQDITDRLTFHVDDYKAFMESRYYGEIINFSEAEDRSSAQYKCRPYPQSTDSQQSRLTFLIQFQVADNGYDATLSSYYE